MPPKKGFWIKKTGLIRVDTTFTPRENYALAKVEKNKKPVVRLSTSGKSGRYMRDVIIPDLIKRINYQRSVVNIYKRIIARFQKSVDELVKQIRRDYFKRLLNERKKIVKVHRAKITKEVNRRVDLRIGNLTKHKSAVYQGILGHMITENYCIENKISPKLLGVLTFISLFKVALSTDLNFYDYNMSQNFKDRLLHTLVTKGWIIKEPRKRAFYISISGQQIVDDYQKAFLKQKMVIDKKRKRYGTIPTKKQRYSNKEVGIGD